MDRIILIITLAFTLSLLITEKTLAQRYLPGQKGIQLTASAVDGFKLTSGDGQAFALGIGVATYNKSGNRWIYGIEYLQKQYGYSNQYIPVSQFTGEIGYYKKFLSDYSKTIFVSIGASLMSGYETVNWGKKELYDGAVLTNKDKFLYGGAIGLEIETFLTDRMILLIHCRERILPTSTIGKFHFQAGAGIKFIIN
ncbi:conjugal transfer protein TraO [Prevotella sp. 10(H)]|uniref:conjugal transfer protein TraO n=1 Tax=Prevotella sp. 10(H) TaxID=1158294 RepID=UPI0004A740CC|nr:conjugal transfer protein TraO [Prevotella sp. 10(H)]